MTRAPMCLASWMAKPADAARPALDQDRLAGLELQRVLDRTQGGQADERERRRVDMRHPGRLLGHDGRADGDLLAVGAVAAGLQHAEHLVADLEVLHTGADGADHAGEITPQDHREGRLLVVAGRHLGIGAVDARGHGVDHDLARAGDRIGKIAVFQDLRSAEFLDVSSFHGVPASLQVFGNVRRPERSEGPHGVSTRIRVATAMRSFASLRMTLPDRHAPRAPRIRRPGKAPVASPWR